MFGLLICFFHVKQSSLIVLTVYSLTYIFGPLPNKLHLPIEFNMVSQLCYLTHPEILDLNDANQICFNLLSCTWKAKFFSHLSEKVKRILC